MLDIPRIQGLILDMDGVLWRGPQPIGNLLANFEMIHSLGLKVVLASNNASKSVDTILAKLASFGVKLQPDQVINSGVVAAQYLKKRHPEGGNVYIVGESGLVETLAEAGFSVNGQSPVLAVVVGIDRQINYDKIAEAAILVRSGVPFIGTNPDKTFPGPDGLLPGAGSIIASIEAASEVKPIVLGKPETEIFEVALDRMALSSAEAVIVGDRIETDIVCGQRLGMQTALVLSGVASLQQAENHSPPIDWIGEDLFTLLNVLAIENGS